MDFKTNAEYLSWIEKTSGSETRPTAQRKATDDLSALMCAIAPVISDAIKSAIVPLQERIKALEARPTTGVKYCGIWRGNCEFDEGSLVTHAGGLWVSKSQTNDKPGTSSNWQLVSKSGDRR
jgi:hypothetical protein